VGAENPYFYQPNTPIMSLPTGKRYLLILTMSVHALAYSQTRLSLSDKNASAEAKALYSYLQDMAGKKILAGQMASEWGFDEIGYIQQLTGKLPAIKGMDFIERDKNEAQVKAAEDWWKRGGIPTIMWHWGAPGIGEGYENSKKEIDIDKCFEKGTPEYDAFWKELDEKAALLEKLKEAKVPVLWRPFHELNVNWFWWGKKGASQFRRLWITMYDYYVHQKKLDNLIWVLCYTASPDSAWYPGRDYVDIAGADDYQQTGPHVDMYKKVRSIVGDGMPIPFHECGVPPDPVASLAGGAKWSWFMEWHTSFIQKVDTTYLKYIYDNDLVVTLDKLPNIMGVYGKK
jgi:hypothetical protein